MKLLNSSFYSKIILKKIHRKLNVNEISSLSIRSEVKKKKVKINRK